VKESTSLIKISGFITKPEVAKKNRGEQYFFVNKRFIKHHYLHHAIKNAFGELLPEDYHPGYFINFDMDPEKIDINIHPTKTEVNFQDEKSIYSIVKSAVKMTLGKHTLSPQIDFDTEASLDFGPPPKGKEIKQPQIKVNPDYNPFNPDSINDKSASKPRFERPQLSQREISNSNNWQDLYKDLDEVVKNDKVKSFQLANKFIITHIKSGLLIINQQAAHERVLYDRFSDIVENGNISSQMKIFEETIEFSPSDVELILDLKSDLNKLGFRFTQLDSSKFRFEGVPADLANEDMKNLFESTLDFYKTNQVEMKIDQRKNLIMSMAKNLTVKKGRKLELEEQQALISSLFECKQIDVSPSGSKIYELLSHEKLNQIFNLI
jgi:DNA mismatch repair protein MutL